MVEEEEIDHEKAAVSQEQESDGEEIVVDEPTEVIKEFIFQYDKVFVRKEGTLQPLLDEEAFYLLSHATIAIPDATVATLFAAFYRNNSRFALKYKVFSHFKDQGFVVKGGANYGLDFSVYRRPPQFCHSEICCYVVNATEPFVDGKYNPQNGQVNWQQLTTLTRVMPDVMKTLLLCYVLPAECDLSQLALTPPATATAETIDLSSLECLEKLRVQPITALVRRQPAGSELPIGSIYNKHKKGSVLATPRLDKQKKKKKVRRDLSEIRDKVGTVHNKQHWQSLQEKAKETEVKAAGSKGLLGGLWSAVGWIFGVAPTPAPALAVRATGASNKKRGREEASSNDAKNADKKYNS